MKKKASHRNVRQARRMYDRRYKNRITKDIGDKKGVVIFRKTDEEIIKIIKETAKRERLI
jgi:hypothetical protein